jgi:hypothetical protein
MNEVAQCPLPQYRSAYKHPRDTMTMTPVIGEDAMPCGRPDVVSHDIMWTDGCVPVYMEDTSCPLVHLEDTYSPPVAYFRADCTDLFVDGRRLPPPDLFRSIRPKHTGALPRHPFAASRHQIQSIFYFTCRLAALETSPDGCHPFRSRRALLSHSAYVQHAEMSGKIAVLKSTSNCLPASIDTVDTTC